ncbi:hypothetical protein D3C80_1307580 [compost metagenome]
MVGRINRNDFSGDHIRHYDLRQRNVFGNGVKTGGGQQSGEGDGFGQCMAFHRQSFPCDRWQQTAYH